MYSEQELTKIIGDVLDSKIEDGDFNEVLAGLVDDYLEEHPVDITALEGKDISLKSLTSTNNVSVGGNLSVTGNITGASIIENMSGYSADTFTAFTPRYLGACKNGNKLTFAIAGALTTDESHPGGGAYQAGYFRIPTSIANKIIPYSGTLVALNSVDMATNTYSVPTRGSYQITKDGNTFYFFFLSQGLSVSTTYNVRFDITFLLSDSLVE